MLEFSSTTKTFLFLLKTLKNKHPSVSDYREYTVSRFKGNANIFPKSTTTQENITISRHTLLFLLKKQRSNHSSAGDWWRNTKSIFIQRMLELFQKFHDLRRY